MVYRITFRTKWADFDANKHLRHTAYNDYAAECRVSFFNENGLPLEEFEHHNFGPILFKEETSFFREIKLGEQLTVDLVLQGCSKKGERFKMLHHIYKENGVLAAEIKVYAAWIDLSKRKLITPPSSVIDMFNTLDKTADFEEIKLKTSN